MTTNMFASMLHLTGLSETHAASYLKVRLRVLRRWTGGQQAPPAEVIRKLNRLHEEQQTIADEICEAWEAAGKKAEFIYEVSASDADALNLGWPSREAQIRAVALAQMILSPVRITIENAETEPEQPDSQLLLFTRDKSSS